MRKYCYFILIWILCAKLPAQDVQVMTINGIDYTYSDPSFELLKAAFEGDTGRIIAFLEQGADVNTTTWDGVAPLMYAAQEGHLRVVEILLRNGANVNLKPYNQVDALLGAVIAGHVFVADTLILNGANVDTRNINDCTPLMYAAAYGDMLMTDMLIFYGASVNAADHFGNRAIHYSAFYDHPGITKMLIDQGALIDATDQNGFTPLMIAAQNGYSEHVTFLVEAGAEVNMSNNDNLTPLALAIANAHLPVIEYLISQGAGIDHQVSDKVNVSDLVFIYGNSHIREFFRNMEINRQNKLSIDQITINSNLSGNNKDLMIGGEISVHEMKTGLNYALGYMIRPAVRSVLYKMTADTLVQYWESRSLFHLGAGKFFYGHRNNYRYGWGGFAWIYAAYTYGNFRGSANKPDNRLLPLIRAGLFYDYRPLQIKLTYEYLKFKPSKASPHRIGVSVGFVWGLSKYKIRFKQEPRL